MKCHQAVTVTEDKCLRTRRSATYVVYLVTTCSREPTERFSCSPRITGWVFVFALLSVCSWIHFVIIWKSNFSVLLDNKHQIWQLTRYRIRVDYSLSLSNGKSLLTPCTSLNALTCFTPVGGMSSEVLRFPSDSVAYLWKCWQTEIWILFYSEHWIRQAVWIIKKKTCAYVFPAGSFLQVFPSVHNC